eukprot:COSAG02_NODE_1195_length_13940_cov_15.482407_7_plen_143_part_00
MGLPTTFTAGSRRVSAGLGGSRWVSRLHSLLGPGGSRRVSAGLGGSPDYIHCWVPAGLGGSQRVPVGLGGSPDYIHCWVPAGLGGSRRVPVGLPTTFTAGSRHLMPVIKMHANTLDLIEPELNNMDRRIDEVSIHLNGGVSM